MIKSVKKLEQAATVCQQMEIQTVNLKISCSIKKCPLVQNQQNQPSKLLMNR